MKLLILATILILLPLSYGSNITQILNLNKKSGYNYLIPNPLNDTTGVFHYLRLNVQSNCTIYLFIEAKNGCFERHYLEKVYESYSHIIFKRIGIDINSNDECEIQIYWENGISSYKIIFSLISAISLILIFLLLC